MAIVKLKDVPVTFINSRGFGVKVTESHESGEKTFKQQFTLWFGEAHGLNVGDIITVSGFLGAKVGTWTDRDGQERHSVELSLNSPRLDGDSAASGGGSGASGASEWADTPPSDSAGLDGGFTYSDESPF